MAETTPLRVLVTGAAGQIGYAVCFAVADGSMFGPQQSVILHMLEREEAKNTLLGVEMELNDGAFPLLHGIVGTVDPVTAFTGVDAIVMVGAFPRLAGMERKDLLEKNLDIFKTQGALIEQYASKNVKVLVVGNPANTNCLIASQYAPSIPKKNFSALTRLDQNRAVSEIARRAGVHPGDVSNIIIWGNHSTTQFPDTAHGVVNKSGKSIKVAEVVDQGALEGEFITMIQNRGGAVIKQRGASSAQSAARAIVCHMRDWFLGTQEGQFVSMAVVSDGKHYGIPEGLVFSFPCTCSNGDYTVVGGLELSDFAKEKLRITTEELQQEQTTVHTIIESRK